MSAVTNLGEVFASFPSGVVPDEGDAVSPPIVFEGPLFVPQAEPVQPSIFGQIEGWWKRAAKGIETVTGGKVILPRPEDRISAFEVPGIGTAQTPLPPAGVSQSGATSALGLGLVGVALVLALFALKR